MKANELRRNNLIFYGNMIYPVDRIMEQSISVRIGSQSLRTAKPHEFEPVPLSPEILQACGFENTHPPSWHLSWESYELQYSTDDKELGIMSPDGCTSGHTVYFPCGQLHLLQNIYFFFTGAELVVNLE